MLLVLSPLGKWGIVVAELRFVASTGQYLERGKRVREELLDEDASQELRQLVAVCSELTSDFLYLRFANKQVHRREADFWASDDRALRSYIKSMADKRLEKAMSLAEELDIPIHYPITDKGTLYAGDRLQFRREVPVALVMDFHRHDQGTDYRIYITTNYNCHYVTGPDTIRDQRTTPPVPHHVVVANSVCGSSNGSITFLDTDPKYYDELSAFAEGIHMILSFALRFFV